VTVRELIDFHLAIQQPGTLVGFTELYADAIEELKAAIQEHYGSQEAWLGLRESEVLPETVENVAKRLVTLHASWKA